MMKWRGAARAPWILAVCLMSMAASASAQQPTQAQSNAIRQACRADYQAHCASVPAGGSASLACLQQNAASLSPGCQGALAAISPGAAATAPPRTTQPAAPPTQQARPPLTPREEAAMMRQACGRDYQMFCRGVPPGGGRALGCLQAHGSQLSHQCRSALSAARGGG